MNKQILTLKELREAKGYTQESLGRAVGLSRLAITKYELKQTEPKLGNFLKIAQILEVSLAELALAMGYEWDLVPEKKKMQVYRKNLGCAPAQNEELERGSMQVHNDDPDCTPAKRGGNLAIGNELELMAEEPKVQLHRENLGCTPAQNDDIERGSMQVRNGNRGCTPAKRRAKGKGTGFIEERLVKRGNKQYKQYWFHWQKTEPGKRRVFATSKYIPKRLVAKIIEKNNQKLPVREILKSLGVKE